MASDFNKHEELSVECIVKGIKQEASRRRGSQVEFASPCIDTSKLRSFISVVEQNVNVGAEVTPMEQFSGISRRVALSIGKIIVYLASFITFKQRNFNQGVVEALKATATGFDGLLVNLTQLSRDEQLKYEGLQAQLHELKIEYEATVDNLSSHISILNTKLVDRESQIKAYDLRLAALQTSLTLQERRLSLSVPQVSQSSLPDDTQKMGNFDSLDALYAAFEEQFRGSREDIKQRVRVYLPVITEVGARLVGRSVLDIGCGRGEWLELLKEQEFNCKGVDLNNVMVEQCLSRGLDVAKVDALDYLRTLPDESLGAVTGFHIIEHLPFMTLLALLDEILRVLTKGGVIIFETPNPQNVLVGSCNFYMDPTHRNPLPSQLTMFLMEFKGFHNCKILNLSYSTATVIDENTETARRFNDYFYGPQDYSVIAYKP